MSQKLATRWKPHKSEHSLLLNIKEIQITPSYTAMLCCLAAEQGVEGGVGAVFVYFPTLVLLLLEFKIVMELVCPVI